MTITGRSSSVALSGRCAALQAAAGQPCCAHARRAAAPPRHGRGRRHREVLHLKHHRHGGRHRDDLAADKAQLLVVVQDWGETGGEGRGRRVGRRRAPRLLPVRRAGAARRPHRRRARGSGGGANERRSQRRAPRAARRAPRARTRVHVFDPQRVDRPVKHDPLLVGPRVARGLAHAAGQQAVGPLVRRLIELPVQLAHGDGLGVEHPRAHLRARRGRAAPHA